MLLIRELNSGEAAANTMNIIQEYAEGSRLGVPVLVSMVLAAASTLFSSRISSMPMPSSLHHSCK